MFLKISFINFLVGILSFPGFSQKLNANLIYSEKMSSRALFLDGNRIWFGMDKGRYGYYDENIDTTHLFKSSYMSDKTEIRSIAGNEEFIFLLSVGNPATLTRVNKKTLKEELVYSEVSEKVFYDSMHFKDNQTGFAMGDPTDECLSVLKTKDFGYHWEKLPCSQLPNVVSGEAAFAASNTNLKVIGSKIILASGGKKSRVFISDNEGNTFSDFETPLIQGKTMTGIFTMDFYNEKIGIIAGGDYEIPEENKGNLALTKDGGKTWKLISEGKGPGYISCIQFIPNSKGKKLISVGATGVYFSKNTGKTWKKLSNIQNIYSIKFKGKNTFYGAGNSIWLFNL